MRISDWSSDVCSSDLEEGIGQIGARRANRSDKGRKRADVKQRTAAPSDVAVARAEALVGALDGTSRHRLVGQHAPFGIGSRARRINEIGRASCRERVCQYV